MTDEQWEKIKPFAEAKQRANASYNAALARNSSTETREFYDQMLDAERLSIEYREACEAFSKAVKQHIGIVL